MATVNQAYNAITGAELKKIILAEVGRALDNAGINSPGISYPLCSWAWTLDISQQVGENRERHIEAAGGRTDAASELAEALKGGSKRFKAETPSPNEVRQAEGLPLPEA